MSVQQFCSTIIHTFSFYRTWTHVHVTRSLYTVACPSVCRLSVCLCISVFIFNFFISLFCFVPCGRLSWLFASFWAHVNILHRLSFICLSVCLSVTLVHPTQAIVIFRNISTEFGTVAVLQMQCMYRPVIPSFIFCIFHIEIGTVLESRACS